MRPLLDEVEIAGKVITADALLTQKAIAEYLVNERGADFVFTVKANEDVLRRIHIPTAVLGIIRNWRISLWSLWIPRAISFFL